MFSVSGLLPTPPVSPSYAVYDDLNADAVKIPRENLTLNLLKEKLTEYLETIVKVVDGLPYQLRNKKQNKFDLFKATLESWLEETRLLDSLEEEAEKWIKNSSSLVEKIDELPPLIWES